MHSYILSLKTIPKGRSVSYNQLQVIIQGKKYSVVGNKAILWAKTPIQILPTTE